MNPKFSICIPNFNYARYIGETIQSVLNQDYQNFEILVADNASTDDSVEVVNSFKDERIKLYQNKYNVGFAPNLDKATEQATGDYMILLSSDDLMLKGALQAYSDIIERFDGLNNDLIIMSACDIVDSKGDKIGTKTAATGNVLNYLRKTNSFNRLDDGQLESYSGHHILKSLLSGTFQPAGQFMATCYSRKLFESVEGYRSIMSMWPDAQFSHKMLFEDPTVVYLNKSMFGYRVHDANNLAVSDKLSNIKILTDGYLLSLAYSGDLLKRIGMEQKDLKRSFINNICLHHAFWSMARGSFRKSYHYLTFAMASYPALVWSRPVTYGIMLGWLLTPVSRLIYLLKTKVS